MNGWRFLLLVVVMAAGWTIAGAARASGDYECMTVWKLDQTLYAECNNLPFLSPGNDTRVNLQLLLLDARRATIEPPPKTDPPIPPIASSASPFTWEGFVQLAGPKGPAKGDQADADSYAEGEGSRCKTNADGGKAFEAALAASPAVPAADRALLVSARDAVAPSCNEENASTVHAPPAALVSPLGKQFGEYLAGAADFYDGSYDDARVHFTALKDSRQPWLKETARYMLGRVAVNKAQGWDQYGRLTPASSDQAAVKEADEAFRAYLADYPTGLYAASARGLMRRVDWLGARPKNLANDYAWSFAHAGPDERNVGVGDLVLEEDSKLITAAPGADVGEPMLTATIDLMQMRSAPPDETSPQPVIKYDDLVAQKPVFAASPELYGYLLAAHRFYIEHDPAGALGGLGDAAPAGPMGDVAFSRLVLKGLALQANKDWAAARQLWLQMIPLARPAFQRPTLDLALAFNEERSGRLAEVFAKGSLIKDPQVREILLRNDAAPALLIQQVRDQAAAPRERRVARYVLLFKDVMRGRYAAFPGDQALQAPPAPAPQDPDDPLGAEPDATIFDWPGRTDGFQCPDLMPLVAGLAAQPHAPHSLLCLGDFVRAKDLDFNALDKGVPAGELGGAASEFPGRPFARLDAYRAIIADSKAPAGDRAFALYRAINCFASSGNNHCDGQDVGPAERERWFHLLKHDYADTPWAKVQKYYW